MLFSVKPSIREQAQLSDRVRVSKPHAQQISSWLVALAAIVAVLNLIGWMSDSTSLISMRPGLPSMVPVTAILILATSFGIWRLSRRTRVILVPTLVFGAVILATAFIQSFHVIGSAPFPFQLASSGKETHTTVASSMTAGMLFALGWAALALVYKRFVIIAQCTALIVLLVALLNLGGYILQDTFLFKVLPSKGTSIFTSTALVLLAAAILFARPYSGLMIAVMGDLPGARITRRLLLAVLLIPIVSGMIVSTGSQVLFYDPKTMLILFVWIVILLFLIIVWRLAMKLAASDKERADAQENLRQAVNALQAEHQNKDQFMATLAHELRNPLMPISSAAELLKHGGAKTESDKKRLGEMIAAQCTNLVNLVNDLMDMERLNTGRLTLNKTPIDVRKAIGAAVEQIAPLLDKRKHRYEVDLPITPVCIRGDFNRLIQIFANLLSNAAKYTAPGGQISIHAVVCEESVKIIVNDNGQGMNTELLAHLFEPYVQAQLTPSRTDGGLGLGLTLVKKLTELHSGTVTASSPGPGNGSTFEISFPLWKIGDVLKLAT